MCWLVLNVWHKDNTFSRRRQQSYHWSLEISVDISQIHFSSHGWCQLFLWLFSHIFLHQSLFLKFSKTQSNRFKLWESPNEHQLCTFYALWIPRNLPLWKQSWSSVTGHLQTLIEETWELNETVKCYRFPLSTLLESEIMLNEFISKWIGSFQWTGSVQCINILQWWRQISLWSEQQYWEKIFAKQTSDKELVSRT